jgi:uracil-DNA glycosylase
LKLAETLAEADVLPPAESVFAAFESCSPTAARVVILGQDPYPTPGDAHGLSFSVAHGKAPRSLVNIFTEIQRDIGGPRRIDANLSDWACQGVLLLNSSLTTPPGAAGGHGRIGWQGLTQAALLHLVELGEPLVICCWGGPARKIGTRLPARPGLLILESGHPSPLAYNRPATDGFKACGHFAAINEFLTENGRKPIDWIGSIAER